MAKGRKTGGRNFTKGDKRAGRPKGSKDKIPRTWKHSLKVVFEEVCAEHPDVLHAAMLAGFRAGAPKSFPYLQLAAHYIDGRPITVLELTGKGGGPIKIEDVREAKASLRKKLDALMKRVDAVQSTGDGGES